MVRFIGWGARRPGTKHDMIAQCAGLLRFKDSITRAKINETNLLHSFADTVIVSLDILITSMSSKMASALVPATLISAKIQKPSKARQKTRARNTWASQD